MPTEIKNIKYTDSATLAFYRVAFGLLMCYSMVRFMLKGWVDTVYVKPEFHFKYFGFSWVADLGIYTYVLFIIATLSSIMIMLGYKYRLAAVLFFLSFTWIELLEKTTYLNHYYFISVLSFILIFLPLDQTFALGKARSNWKDWVPSWTVFSLKMLISIVYFYAGLAKLNSDWLLEAQPLSLWLRSKYDLPLIGLDWIQQPWFYYAMSWGGAIYDLAIPFLLWNRKTQKFAFVLVIFFHVLTRILFPIGMFPFIMIASSLIFFPSKLHRKWLGLRGIHCPKPIKKLRFNLSRSVVMTVLILQILIPWRYLAYPGELFWTEEGFRFSWRVMLMEKSGYTTFTIHSKKTGTSFVVNNEDFLTSYQIKQMSFQPDMILEYAHYLGDYYTAQGIEEVAVYADSFVALNGRRSQRFVDPDADLYQIEDTFKTKTWLLPFNDEIKGL